MSVADFPLNESEILRQILSLQRATLLLLSVVIGKESIIMGNTTQLVAAVGQIKSDADAIKTAVDNLLAAQAAGDQAAIDQAVADLGAAHTSLTATIAEATPTP